MANVNVNAGVLRYIVEIYSFAFCLRVNYGLLFNNHV